MAKRLRKIGGYAFKFDDIADRGEFFLMLHPNAFDESIAAGDVQGLLHHEKSSPIARQKNGSMALEKRSDGLWVELQPNNTAAGRDAIELVETGDVRGQSIGFDSAEIDIIPGKRKTDKPTVIVLKARLKEDSIVTWPAMKGSSLGFIDQPKPSKELAELREQLSKRA